MQQVLTKVAWTAKGRNEDLVKLAFRNVCGARIAVIQILHQSIDEGGFYTFTLIEVSTLLRITVFVTLELLDALVYRYVQKVLERCLQDPE